MFQTNELNDLLEFAIEHKKTNFIRKLIEHEANIKSYLTVERFERMLQKHTPENSFLHELLLKKCGKPEDWKFEHFEMVRIGILQDDL